MFNVRPPWLFVPTRRLEDGLPGFHVARETLQGVLPDTYNFRRQSYVQDADAFLRGSLGSTGTSRPPGGSGMSFDFLTGRSVNPELPRIAKPLVATPGLHNFEPQPEFVPGFHVEPAADDSPGFRVGATYAQNSAPDDADNWLFGYNPDVGNPPGVGTSPPDVEPQDEEGSYTVPPLVYDPVRLPEPPQDHIREALDQIARIYRDAFADSSFRRPTAYVRSLLPDGTDGNRKPSTDNRALDPRFIILAQANPPPRPPPFRRPKDQHRRRFRPSARYREDRRYLICSRVPETTIHQVRRQLRPHHRLHSRLHNQGRADLRPSRLRLSTRPIRQAQRPQHSGSKQEFLGNCFQIRS